MKTTPIYAAFRETIEAIGFIQDTGSHYNKGVYGFFRDLNGINQLIYFHDSRDLITIPFCSDIVGLYGFNDTSVTISTGIGTGEFHFHKGMTSWLAELSQDKHVEAFLRALESKLLDMLQRDNTPEKLASLIPVNYFDEKRDGLYASTVLNYRYEEPPDRCFMRMISSNLYIRNLDLAQEQSRSLLKWCNSMPYDTTRIEKLAVQVIELQSLPEESPVLAWEKRYWPFSANEIK